MKENYTLYINSVNSLNRIGAAKYNYQYYINWSSFLPKPDNVDQKFLVRFIFTNNSATGIIGDIFSLYINFGGSNAYDTSNSKSNFLGLIYPTSHSTFGYTKCNTNDNLPVTIEYPNNNIITVTLSNVNNVNYAIDYSLVLEFIPI